MRHFLFLEVVVAASGWASLLATIHRVGFSTPSSRCGWHALVEL